MEPGDDGTLAGWHRDPSGRHELRFWDGVRWTEHIIDEGIPGLDPPTRSGRIPQDATLTPAPPPPAAEVPTADVATADVATADVATADVATADVATADVATADVATAEVPTAEVPTADVAAPVVEPIGPEIAPEPIAPEPVIAATREFVDLSAAETNQTAVHADAEVASDVSTDVEAVVASDVEPDTESDAGADIPADEAPVPEPEPVAAVDEPATVASAAASVSAARDAGPSHARAGRPPREPRLRRGSAGGGSPSSTPAKPPVAPVPPGTRPEPVRVIADPPTVASPAGNSAGENTSAIADPHRAFTPAGGVDPAPSPRVAGASVSPVKRFRPGSPPPSPFAGPRALPASGSATIGTLVTPWYRRASGWVTVLGIVAAAAIAAAVTLAITDDTDRDRVGGRPPAAAPQGSKVIDGDGFGIAVPSRWIVATDPGNTFPQLDRGNWGTPLAATDVTNGEALVAVPLHNLSHDAQVDPELFWSDQVRDAGSSRSISPGRQLGVHGFAANQASITDPSGDALVAASIHTGDGTFLVAVTARTEAEANARFERLIQTFDAR